MSWLFSRVLVVVMLATGLLVALDGPAQAHIEIDDYLVLPQTGHGDVVRLPGTSVLAISGGDDDPVVMVDVALRTVRVVPGTEGVRTLDLDQDGTHLHGVSHAPGEVVEIDVRSGEVSRRWPVGDFCVPSDAVMRGGVIWVIDACPEEVWRLDPATGALSLTGAKGRSLVGAPHSPEFYTHRPGSGLVSKWEATAGGLIEEDWGGGGEIYGSLQLSDDGGTLFVRNTRSGSSVGGRSWDATDLRTSDEAWPSSQVPTWSDGIHFGVALLSQGVAGVVTHDDRSVVNTFLPAGVETYLSTDDVRLVDGVLAVTGRVSEQKRLYVVADPLLREPMVTLDVPWGRTGLDTPTPVNGIVRREGVPVAGQELQLLQISPTRRDLGTVTTDAQGEWSTQWRPEQVGRAVLEVRYDGERDSVARESVWVDEDYYRLDSIGPTEVQGGDDIVVTFRATHNGQPMKHIELGLARHRLALYRWQLEETTTQMTDVEGEVTVGVTAGAADRYDFVATHTFPDGYGEWEVHHSLAVRRTATVLSADEPPDAVPGDPVTLALTLTTSGGESLVGQEVRFEVDPASGPTLSLTATTDEEGRASVVDHSEAEGWYQVYYYFDGTAELDDAQYGNRAFSRNRIPTTMTVTGNATGEIGEVTTLQGTVSPAEGPVEVTLTDVYAGTVTTTTTDESGSWSAAVTPTLPGPNGWRAAFPGTVRLAPSQQTFYVSTPRTPTSVENLAITGAAFGEYYLLTGTFTGRDGHTRLQVSWDGGASQEVITAADGTFAFRERLFLGAGPHVVRVAYDGDFRHAPTQREMSVEVAKGDQGLTVGGPSIVSPNHTLTLVGQVNYYSTRSTEVTVTGPDGGVSRLPVSFVDDNYFRVEVRAPDTPGQHAQWTVTLPGDANHETDSATFSTYVRKPHSVTFTPGAEPYVIGREASLLIQVPDSSAPDVSIRVRDPQGVTVWSRNSWDGPFPAEGLTFGSTLLTALRVEVIVQEDAQHHWTEASYVIRPPLKLSTRMSKPLFVKGRYSVYDTHQRTPRVITRSQPYPAYPSPSCVHHVFQKLTPDGWKQIRTKCAQAYESRLVTWVHASRLRAVGARYRVSHLHKPDEWYQRTQGGWHYVRFR